jgi:hypothetical protein
MNLEQTATSLLEQFPTDQRPTIRKHEEMLDRFGRIVFGGFGVVVLAGIVGIIYAILTKMVFSGANFWAGLLLIAFVIFAGLSLTYVVLNESLKEKRSKLNPQTSAPTAELGAPDTGRLLPESKFEPAISVTEDTTGLLTPSRETRTRKL